MKDRVFWDKIHQIADKEKRFSPDAYEFVSDAVVYTAKILNRTESTKRHISGKELLEGIKVFASQQFGPLAGEVFRGWGIKDSTSVGEIVFSLVEFGILGKTEKDSINDFSEGLDIDNDFSLVNEDESHDKISAPPTIIA